MRALLCCVPKQKLPRKIMGMDNNIHMGTMDMRRVIHIQSLAPLVEVCNYIYQIKAICHNRPIHVLHLSHLQSWRVFHQHQLMTILQCAQEDKDNNSKGWNLNGVVFEKPKTLNRIMVSKQWYWFGSWSEWTAKCSIMVRFLKRLSLWVFNFAKKTSMSLESVTMDSIIMRQIRK